MKHFLLKIWKALPPKLKIFFFHLLRPKYMVAVAAIVFDKNGKVLLGKHTYRKCCSWGILAGNLEYGEDPKNAIVRELREETGLEIRVEQLLKAVSAKEDHHISLIYACKIVDGVFQPSAEISAIEYFSPDELPKMLSTEKALIQQLVFEY
ncbi:MAG: NUDIX hydrolase [Anaerolineae bacterium]|jgi:8-oxo-dGTP diphosphatase|nr:NUDIX hydrolase [Anaerolineae bacterium]MBT7190411.1 NUDIX hydrolase [Anaerolineae bacterium]MBT7988914.1 NUDIX hydrolase [Anaerolineae bacterium]